VHDLLAACAAASDDQAQRWLGWRPEQLIAEQHRAALLARRPGTGTRWASDPWLLIAIDRASGRLAGAASVNQEHQIGGWLGQQFRDHGLGRELFLGIATFAHHHLGMATVRAGVEPANTASVSALTSAGFVTTSGPTTHRLPDSRTVPAQWFRHDTEHPTACQ
jgi:RimJ/RimL family protein N-acetyltransferase